MADFSALKTSIQNYIKQNGNEEITGNLLQQILLSMVSTLGDSAINDLVTALNAEIANRGNADTELGGRITTLQGVINGIIANVENGYVYAGIATPSTTPVSGKVFYLALTAGTYTNFGATEVPQGINILKYNGSAWSLDSFLGLDDAPTQGSNNLVKSGGVLDSIIKDGPAFDLSAYNNGATYADLSAALTALNALPAAYKKGGMSFKYVQTSDNKYVQYRLMAHEWSIVESDWQGVDYKPTLGSNNLVKSGGIAEMYGVDANISLIDNQLWNGGNGNPVEGMSGYCCSKKYGYIEGGVLSCDVSILQFVFWNGTTFLGADSSYDSAPNGTTIFACNFGENITPSYLNLKSGLIEGAIKIQNHIEEIDSELGVLDNINILENHLWNGLNGSDVALDGRYSTAKHSYITDVTCNTDGDIYQVLFWQGDTFLGYSDSYNNPIQGANIFAINYDVNQTPTYFYLCSGIKKDIKELENKSDLLQEEINGLQSTKSEKRQFIFVNKPSSGILKNVNEAVLEIYVPSYVQGRTYLNSVRKLQTFDNTIYNIVGVEIYDEEGNYKTLQFQDTDPNYDFGDGVQLLKLTDYDNTEFAYVLFDWNKIDSGTGYGAHEQNPSWLIQECDNVERCPIIKCALTESEIPDNVVTTNYLKSVLANYLNVSTANNYYANKENTNNLLAQHTSQISENAQDINTIEQNIASINSALSSLTSQLPAGAITGNNVWTGENEFAQKVRGVGGTNDDEFVVFGQIKNTLHRNVDVADYGADPSKTASENTTAINSALSGGNKTVTITKPGVYLLNSSLLIDDNTELKCSKGVILKKATAYNYVIRNIGAATRSQNSNIVLSGLYIDCDNKYENNDPLSSPLYGCLGQILMFHVNNVRMCDITIINAISHAIQLCTFYNVVIDGFNIITTGDGVHVNRGEHLICKNGIIESGDDSCALNASDWLNSCPEVGSIHDCHYENIIEKQSQNSYGNFSRHLVGKWVDWYDGMEIVHGDKVVSNGHVYRAYTNRSPNTFISHTQPNCNASTGTQEDTGGFTWRFTNEDPVYEADISNITYRNIVSEANRLFFMTYYETGNVQGNVIYDRSLYPTINHADYPFVKDIVIDGLEKANGRVINISAYIKSQYVFKNVHKVSDFALVMDTTQGDFSIEHSDFTLSPSIYFRGTKLNISNCIGIPTLDMTKGKIISNNNVNSLPSANEKGSICMYDDVPYYNNGVLWESLIS